MQEVINERATRAEQLPARAPRVRNPFSLLLYYQRNSRRVLPIVLVLIFSFFGVAMPVVVMNEIKASPQKVIGLFDRVALVWPNSFNGYSVVDGGRLRQLPDVAALYPAVLQWTYWPSIVGDSPGATNVLGLAQPDMQPVLDRLETRLVAGRLPQTSAPEIAMYAAIARRRGLEIGDKLNPQEDLEELAEEFVVVGLLDGPAPVSIISRDYLVRNSPIHRESAVDRGWLVFPTAAGSAGSGYPRLDAALEELASDEIRLRSYATQTAFIGEFTGSLNTILLAMTTVVVIVLSIAVGLMNYVYFMRRLGEFGVLLATGITRRSLMLRAMLETALMITATWVLGFVLTEGVCRLLNGFLFARQEINLTALDYRVFLFTVPVAVLGGITFLLTMFFQLRRLDPVSIIEQRD